jgi:hypothetical protein
MATRATAISPDHVQALNLIDLEFQGKRYQKVREAWKVYLDHLGNAPQGEGDDVQARLQVWNDKIADYLTELLSEMGKQLGYDFDPVHIKKGTYLPKGHTNLETELTLVRRGLIKLLYGDANLKMDIESLPVDQEALDTHKRMMAEIIRAIEERGPGIPISVKEERKPVAAAERATS